MIWPSPHALSAGTAAFLASLVEFIEALTVVLAVGAVRGWRNALAGAGAALLLLAGMVALLGPAPPLPGRAVRLAVGVLTLMFGLRWLRKAILRAAGRMAQRDEAAAFRTAKLRLGQRGAQGPAAWDGLAATAAFQVVMLEGVEVLFIIAAIAAGGAGTQAASMGAGVALALVVVFGVLLHRPITAVPENVLKLAVGVMMTAFGSFWTGEAIGAAWPGGDWALPGLTALWAMLALSLTRASSRAPA